MEQERRTLQRRQAFEREHQRQGDVLVFLLFDYRLGEPWANIGLATVARRLELVEAEPGNRAAQERLGLAHRLTVGGEPAQERVLHDILCIGDRAEHAISDAGEPRTQRIERCSCVLALDSRDHAAFCTGASA